MPKIPEIIPVTDLRQDAAAALKRIRNSKHSVIITQRGRAAAVMLSMEAYERGEQERELLRLLARGEKEIKAGKGYGLDAVLAEVDAVLAHDSPLKTRFTPSARAQFLSPAAYIQRENPVAAVRFRQRSDRRQADSGVPRFARS